MPPDKDMGLYRPVYITTSGPVAVRHGFVSSELSPDLKTAKLTATVELTTATDTPVSGTAAFVIETAGNDLTMDRRFDESRKCPIFAGLPVRLMHERHSKDV